VSVHLLMLVLQRPAVCLRVIWYTARQGRQASVDRCVDRLCGCLQVGSMHNCSVAAAVGYAYVPQQHHMLRLCFVLLVAAGPRAAAAAVRMTPRL
jgi:hypothetical protein